MNLKKTLLFAICIAVTFTPVFAQESNYVRMNRTPNWERASEGRLIHVINNPVYFNQEEFMGALHEYARRSGGFARARNNLQALVNAYIAFNPDYINQPTGDIFVWTGMSRGVPSLRGLTLDPLYQIHIFDNDLFIDDYVYLVLDQLEEVYNSLVSVNDGFFDDGILFYVYQVNADTRITVFTDEYGARHLIGNVNSAESMDEILSTLTEIFSEPIVYLDPNNEGGFIAEFYDSESVYIHENLDSYVGTFTIIGSQMFVEEIFTQEKRIVQRQFCTLGFFQLCNLELGPGWGFVASWENEE